MAIKIGNVAGSSFAKSDGEFYSDGSFTVSYHCSDGKRKGFYCVQRRARKSENDVAVIDTVDRWFEWEKQ
jgi:hypothetical protein